MYVEQLNYYQEILKEKNIREEFLFQFIKLIKLQTEQCGSDIRIGKWMNGSVHRESHN